MKIRKNLKWKVLVEYIQNLQPMKMFMKATWNAYIPRNETKSSLQNISVL